MNNDRDEGLGHNIDFGELSMEYGKGMFMIFFAFFPPLVLIWADALCINRNDSGIRAFGLDV